MDGASGWQLFRRITLPLLSGTLALVVVLLTIGSLQEYTLPAVVTEGGPGRVHVPLQHAHLPRGVRERALRTASAAALLQFVVILVASLIWLRLLRSRWSY